MDNNIDKKGDNKMELNRFSSTLIGVLVTVGVICGGWCYQNGQIFNEMKNGKEQRIEMKEDFKEQQREMKADFSAQICKIEERKVDKEVFEITVKTMATDIKWIRTEFEKKEK